MKMFLETDPANCQLWLLFYNYSFWKIHFKYYWWWCSNLRFHQQSSLPVQSCPWNCWLYVLKRSSFVRQTNVVKAFKSVISPISNTGVDVTDKVVNVLFRSSSCSDNTSSCFLCWVHFLKHLQSYSIFSICFRIEKWHFLYFFIIK